MKKNKDDITLSAVLDFDVNQEDEALMRAYAHQFDTCVHTFYNIIYDEYFYGRIFIRRNDKKNNTIREGYTPNLQHKNYYLIKATSPCLAAAKEFKWLELQQKFIIYAIEKAYGMVKSDIEKIPQHEENLKQYKKDLAKVLEQLKLAKRPNRIKNLKRRAATL